MIDYKDKFILNLEKSLRQKNVYIPPNKIKKLCIFQLSKKNLKYNASLNENKIKKIKDMPHYKLALGLIESTNADVDIKLIDNYKNNMDKSPEDLKKKVENFFAYFELFKAGKINPKPAVLTRLKPDGPLYIVDGNHRSAFSLALQRPLKARILPFDLVFRLHWNKKQRNQILERFNYTIRLNDHVLVPGYRDDMDFKMSQIPAKAIVDKNLIDITASFAMSAIAAKKAGAKSVTCIADSREIAEWSNRFVFFSGCYSDISVRSLDNDRIEEIYGISYDTLIINLEIMSIEQCLFIINNISFRYLIIELEPMMGIDDYCVILDELKIYKKEIIGTLCRSRKDPSLVRELWLFEQEK